MGVSCMRRRLLMAGMIGGLVLVAGSCAWAQDPIHKAGRGVVNVLTGWIEVPKQIHVGSREDNPVIGFGKGLARGVGLTVLRMGVGVYEALTFPIAYPQGFASPYEGMELSDYAWE